MSCEKAYKPYLRICVYILGCVLCCVGGIGVALTCAKYAPWLVQLGAFVVVFCAGTLILVWGDRI